MNVESTPVERRVFPRLYISLYFEYVVRLYGSVEAISERGLLRDISMSGVHFFSETTPKLKPGDIADFIFRFTQSDFNPHLVNEIRAKGVVKRIDHAEEESPQVGIVVEFLSGPLFKYAGA